MTLSLVYFYVLPKSKDKLELISLQFVHAKSYTKNSGNYVKTWKTSFYNLFKCVLSPTFKHIMQKNTFAIF